MFILVRGELHVLDADQTFLATIPEGTVFGEETVLRHLEVRPWLSLCPVALSSVAACNCTCV